MKRTFVWCAVALVSLTIALQAENKMSGGTAQAVAALEQKWAENAKASNADGVAPLLADKFINTGSDGKVTNKAETLAQTKGAKWETNELSDIKVMVYGNTAIATGNWTGKGTGADGKAIDTRERWTDTWIKMSDGKWQCVASQGTTVKM